MGEHAEQGVGAGGPPGRPGPAVLAAALDQAADGILLVDPSGVIVYVSARVTELFGYEHDELVGRTVEILLPSAARALHRRARRRYHASPRVRNMGSGLPLEGRRKDGTTIPLDIRLGPLDDSDLVVASVRDISAHRRAEADLAAERAERLALAERERVGRALHDLVVQRLFGIAATLVALSTTADEADAERLRRCVDFIDDTIEAIREGVLDGSGSALDSSAFLTSAPGREPGSRGALPAGAGR